MREGGPTRTHMPEGAPSFPPRAGGRMLCGMQVFGYSLREVIRIGLAAALFILLAKWLVPKAGVAPLSAVVEKL